MARIAFLTPQYFDDLSYVGGGERYPRNLALGVAETTEHTVQILSFGMESSVKKLHPKVDLRVMPVVAKPKNPLDPVSWSLVEAIDDADLVHIHQAYTRTSECGYLAAKFLNKPIIATDHGGTSSTIGIGLSTLDMVDRVVAYSNFGASLYQTKTRIDIIKGGVDADAFTPSAAPEPREGICFVGRLLPHKGVDRLIQAMPPEYPLTICGRAYHTSYFELLHQLAQGKRVRFLTSADDGTVRDLYQRSWANVLPSVYRDCYGNGFAAPELMGFTLLEAMSCGTTGICSRVGAMPEFVRHGETGFVYDTIEELTGYIRRLATSPELVNAMGRAAHQQVHKEFDYRVAGRAMGAIYDEVLSERCTRPAGSCHE